MEIRKPTEVPMKEPLILQRTEKYRIEAISVCGLSIIQSLGNQEDKIQHKTFIITA